MSPSFKAWFFSALELLLLFAIVLAVLIPYGPVSGTYPSRDSGVFLYTGWRVLHGAVPYLQVWDHKPPVIYYLDALGLALSPDSTWGVWLVEVVSMGISTAFGFYLLKRIYGLFPAIFGSFLWLFTAFYLLAGGNLTNEYALPFQFALLWLFQRVESGKRVGWYGFVVGACTAFLFFTRQNTIGIAIAIGVYLLFSRLARCEFRRLLYDSLPILAGGLLVTALFIGYFALQGALPAFWDTAFLYNFSYVDERDSMDRLNALAQGFNQLESVGLAQIAFLGWGAALLLLGFKKERIEPQYRPLLWMSILALPIEIWMVSIGGRARIPYFLALLPVLSIFAGFTIWIIFDTLLKDIPRFAGALLLIFMVFSLGSVFYADYSEMSGNFLGQSSDGELVTYIQENSAPDDFVLMWGAESTYNFITRRVSPTRFVYQNPLYDQKNEEMVTEFLNDILTNRPRLIVLTAEDKLSDFHFAYQVGALMDQIKSHYSPPVRLENWVVYTYAGQ
jgi:hypothetical protein